jgi:putative PEP-CTERM system histidine kinase
LLAQQQLQLSAAAQAFCQDAQGLPAYLQRKRWVVDWVERASAPEVYADSDLSPLEAGDSAPWLVVPLLHQQRVEAFVVLTHPQPPRALNDEDYDVLKTVGMQLANALALQQASEALACHRQFETYHRLSAYLVHDLKNLGAQLGLIVRNGDTHRHNPAFVDDALQTLQHAADKIEHLVMQLKHANSPSQPSSVLNLTELVEQVLQQVPAQPLLHWRPPQASCPVQANPQQLSRALRNLIENAQQACLPDGHVQLALARQRDCAVLTIRDDGCGMSPDFIAQRLFKPFDTTKGNAGMGIGAYEAREYIVQQRGNLSVDSAAGAGTTLTVQLPLAGCAAV